MSGISAQDEFNAGNRVLKVESYDASISQPWLVNVGGIKVRVGLQFLSRVNILIALRVYVVANLRPLR
jgi:hypothetical protein